MAKSILFVYGTLKRGCRANALLGTSVYLGTAFTEPRYRLIDLDDFPGLVEAPEDGLCVHGELWHIDDDLFDSLDRYEGAPTLFDRDWIAIEGHLEPVVAYFYRGSVPAHAPSGEIWPIPSVPPPKS